jgi:membrane-bound serine protease (ClpP class)
MVAPPPAPLSPPSATLTGADLFAVLVFMAVFVLIVGGVSILIEHKVPGFGSVLHLVGWVILAVWWGLQNPDVLFDVGRMVFVLLFGMPFIVGFVYFARYALEHSPLMLSQELSDGARSGAPAEEGCSLTGKAGIALSPLRPVGRVGIGDRIFDAVSASGWVDEGEAVRVIRYDGGELLVERVSPGQDAADRRKTEIA